MKSITVLLAAVASTAYNAKVWSNLIAHSDKNAIKNKIEFHRKRDRRK